MVASSGGLSSRMFGRARSAESKLQRIAMMINKVDAESPASDLIDALRKILDER